MQGGTQDGTGRGTSGARGPARAWLALLVGVALGWAPATRVVRHDPWEGHARVGSGAELDEATRVYYFELFAELVEQCALQPWEELVNAVSGLARNEVNAARVEHLYGVLASHLPVVRVRWDGTTAWLASSPTIEMARGVGRVVLVEVQNVDGVAHDLSAEFAGSLASHAAHAPRGFTRGFATRLLVDDAAAQTWTLTVLTPARRDSVAVPIRVVEPATILGTVEDADRDRPLAARVYVRGGDAEYRHAQAYRDHASLSRKSIPGSSGRLHKLPFFYSDGTFEIQVPPGVVALTLERGFEFRTKTVIGNLAPGETRTVTLAAGRIVNMRRLDWISGETHVHWVRNTSFDNEDIGLLGVVQRAEDVQVVNNLTLRHRNPQGVEWVRPDHAPMGPVPGHDSGAYLIQMGEEYRNDPFYGHLGFLNLVAPPGPLVDVHGLAHRGLVLPISTGDLLGPFAEDYPVNYSAIDAARRQKPPESRPLIVSAHGVTGEVPADVALGRIDSLDQIRPADYYRFLDCGFRIPLTDGADFPAGLIGRTRCYVKIRGPLTYGAWIDGILRGSTFVTSGPLLWMTLGEVEIGGSLAAAAGDTIPIHLEAHSRGPLGRLQVLSNNELLYDEVHTASSAVVDFDLVADVSRWVVARCSSAEHPSFRPFQERDAAHTSALYVRVDGGRIFVDSGAAQLLRDRCQSAGDDVYENGLFSAPRASSKRCEARDYFYAGRDVYQALIDAHP